MSRGEDTFALPLQNHAQGVDITNSIGIAYHQPLRLDIIKPVAWIKHPGIRLRRRYPRPAL